MALNSESLTAQVSFAIYVMLLFLKQFSQRKKDHKRDYNCISRAMRARAFLFSYAIPSYYNIT